MSDSFKEKVEKIVARTIVNVQSSTRREKNYEAGNDLAFAVDEIMEAYKTGPDVLIAINTPEAHCFSNEPDRLGKVLLWEFGTPNLPQTEELTPKQIYGYSKNWEEELFSEKDKNPNFDYKSFVVGFIERNLVIDNEIAFEYENR